MKRSQKKIKESLSGDLTSCLWNHPKSFSVKVRYNKQQTAYKASFSPGAELVDSKTVCFETKNYEFRVFALIRDARHFGSYFSSFGTYFRYFGLYFCYLGPYFHYFGPYFCYFGPYFNYFGGSFIVPSCSAIF